MTLDFNIDFGNDIPDQDDMLKEVAETHLRDLAEERTDVTGAAVAITQPARETDPFVYQARVVVYMRPDDVAAVKQDDTAVGALKSALKAVERQVREKRDKLDKPWKRADIPGTPDQVE
jgi:ribosome-associated translation inhibitor RaiA